MAEDINLLRPASPSSDRMAIVEARLRRVGVVAAGIVVVVGLLVALMYGLLFAQMQRLGQEKAQLLDRIAGQSQKEAGLIALQSRITTVEKVLAGTTPWSQALDLAAQIAQPGAITDGAVDEQSRFTLTVKAPSLNEALTMVRTVGVLVEEGRIRSPQLESLQLDDDGSVQMRLVFFTVFL